MTYSCPAEPQSFIERDGADVRLPHFQEKVALVRRAEFMNEGARQTFSPVLGMRGDAEDFEFVGERPTPHQIGRYLAIDFRHFEGFVAEWPVHIAECRKLDRSGGRMIRGHSFPNYGLTDDRPAFSVHN